MCHNIGEYNSWTLGYKTFFYYKLMFKPFQLCTISSLVQNQTTRRNFSVHKTLFYWNVTSSLCNVFLLLIHSIKGHTFAYILDVVFVRRKTQNKKLGKIVAYLFILPQSLLICYLKMCLYHFLIFWREQDKQNIHTFL